LLTTAAPEPIIQDWYEGLYLDTYSDYLEMARYWYHGHREIGMWMNRAQEQLDQEDQPVFTDTNRDAFIALATGNTHAHPDYVLARQLQSFPLPLHLRKDARSIYFRETKKALLAHADTQAASDDLSDIKKASKARALSPDVRKRIMDAFKGQQEERQVVSRLSGRDGVTLAPDTRLVVSDQTRLSLEALDHRVTLVLRSPSGERRAVSWDREHALVAAFARATRLSAVAQSPELRGQDLSAFCQELAAAGVLVAPPAA
jgi:hypothetical protein